MGRGRWRGGAVEGGGRDWVDGLRPLTLSSLRPVRLSDTALHTPASTTRMSKEV